jgi:hypothetical protein
LERTILSRAVRVTLYPLILLPAALSLLYVYSFGVSVVYDEAWVMVPLFGKLASGDLSIADLWVQHNEHRMLFPKGVELLLGSITKYDNVAEMYLIQGCFLTTLGILLLAFKQSIRTMLLFFIPISFLVFSLRQAGSMLFGFEMHFAFTQTFGVLSLFLLYVSGHSSLKKLAFVAALGSGTVASFSDAQGLFVWPAGVLQLIISPVEKSTKKAMIVVWGLIGVGEWVAYFVDYEKPEDLPPLFYVFEHPIVGAQYFVTLLGGSLFSKQQPVFALLSGLLLIGCTIAGLLLAYKDRKLGENSFWIALFSYASLGLASITLGRAGLGIQGAAAPRYVTISILATIGVYAILVKLASEKKSYLTRALLGLLTLTILTSIPLSYSYGIKKGIHNEAQKEKAAYVLATYKSQSDERLKSNLSVNDAAATREQAALLERLGYNVFSEP